MIPEKKLNFGAGPAALPPSALFQFSQDLINFKNSGIGVAELSHRTKLFEDEILQEANSSILTMSGYQFNEWRVLWMTGGGTGQFAAVPMNFYGNEGVSVYLITGIWSEKASEEAKKILGSERVKIIDLRTEEGEDGLKGLRSFQSDFETIQDPIMYIYYCDNETVDGIELPDCNYFQDLLKNKVAADTVFIADMSSNFMSRPLPNPSGPTGLIFAGVQKNLGAAGVTVVLVKESLLKWIRPAKFCPSILDYKITSKNNSLLNTPPVLSIHLCGLVLNNLIKKFDYNLCKIDEFSKSKSRTLYSAIESSKHFYCPVSPSFRSRMNVIFKARYDEKEKEFLELSQTVGMIQLKGHRSVGGLRASLYNAIEMDDVNELVKLIEKL